MVAGFGVGIQVMPTHITGVRAIGRPKSNPEEERGARTVAWGQKEGFWKQEMPGLYKRWWSHRRAIRGQELGHECEAFPSCTDEMMQAA